VSKISGVDLWFYFFLKEHSSPTEAMEELLTLSVEELSWFEDFETGEAFFCGKTRGFIPSCLEHVDRVTKMESEIDWEKQWEQFCPYFSEGICRIPLSDFSKSEKTLLIYPGAGFGDLSHPTTLLMMELMGPYVKESRALDLGCGSGVLGLSALALGAKVCYGIDIDSDALLHAAENAKINDLEKKLILSSSAPAGLNPEPDLLFLNMTFEEQKEALSGFPVYFGLTWITSGILEEQTEAYLLYMRRFNLKLEEIAHKEGWAGFVFSSQTSAGDIPVAAT